jgi:aspartate/methionine/tyrosine aminotransferase
VAYPLFLARLLIRSGLARFLPSVQRLLGSGASYLGYYSDRVLAAPREELASAAGFLELHGPDAIDLALPAPRFDLVPSSSTKLPADRRGWPPFRGMPELREAVAEKLRADQDLRLHPHEEVLITQGAAGAFTIALDAFVNPGDRVVLFDPASPLYALTLRQRRARLRWVPTWIENGRTRFRLDLLAKAMRGARLIVVNSPCNPTGGMLGAEDLEQIAWWASRRDVLICSDEVFARYRYDDRPASIGTLPRARPRTLTIGSASQEYALASTRVGWLAGPRHLVRPCVMTATLQAAVVPTLCQQIALSALRTSNTSLEHIRAEFESRRRYAYERLQAVGLKPAWPAGGFFFWVNLAALKMSGRVFAERLLAAERVLVSPGDLFGPSGRDHIRLSYAAEDGRLREGLSRLGEFIRNSRTESIRRAA